MNVIQGAMVIVDLGTPNAKYYWRGQLLTAVDRVFIYRGQSMTVHHCGLDNTTIQQMREYGIKVKEVK